MLFSGSNYEDEYSNSEITLLASAARTATTATAAQTNTTGRGLILYVDITARAASTTLTPSLQTKDPVGGEWITIWTAAAALNSSNTTVAYSFYPSPSADAANLYTEAVDLLLPRTWRINVVHSDANGVTYSLAACVVR